MHKSQSLFNLILVVGLLYVFFVLFYVFLCSLYYLFCDVSYIVCVYMCTEQLPPGGYPIAVKYRVIHKSLRNFQTRLGNNQDRHSRKEHINK